MFIEHGVNDSGELVRIDQVPRGATALHCPYCGGLLTAKKGKIVIAHFAHISETCRQASRDQDAISLPAYDNFNLHLPGKAVEMLHKLAISPYDPDIDEDYLESHSVVKFNEWIGRNRTGGYELTKKGKIVLGQLSLMLFNEFQEPLWIERHEQLEKTAGKLYAGPRTEAKITALSDQLARLQAKGLGLGYWDKYYEIQNQLSECQANEPTEKERALGFDTALTDLHLYRTQWQRVLSLTLYSLSINDGQLYKIGVTTRAVSARIDEIKVDLQPHYPNAKIEILGSWPHRGNVERYFKYRYKNSTTVLGDLTEYYRFDDAKRALRDLRRMKPKTLTALESSILAGEPSDFEKNVEREAAEQHRRKMIRRGMAQTIERGQRMGRPRGSEADDVFLPKPFVPAVREALAQGLSLRQAADYANVSVNTVRKVQRALRSLTD